MFKWVGIIAGLFLLFLGATYGALRWITAWLAGEEAAEWLWSPYEIPIISIFAIAVIILMLVIAVKMKGKTRGVQK